MRRVGILALTCIGCALAQGGRGGVDWTTAGNDAQRSFWVRSDPKISIASMQKPGFQFLWQVKLNNEPRQLNSLTVPVLLERYIGYRGFRSLGFVGGSSDQIFAIDTDLGRIEWQARLASASPAASASLACPGGLTANLTRPTPVSFPGDAAGGRGFGGRGGPARSAVGEAGQGAVTLATTLRGDTGRGRGFPGGPDAGRRGGGGFGRMPSYVHALSSDGMFHTMFVSNGVEPEPPVRFLPANANAHGLILIDNIVYATTSGNCGGVPDALWALDLASKQVSSWKPTSGGIAGASGAAFGPDGTLYVTTTDGELTALEPKLLKSKGSYSTGKIEFTSSPLLLDYNGKALIAAAATDGLHLVDSTSLKKMAAQTGPAAAGDLASWHDASGARWLLAPGATEVRAWKVIGQGDTLTLQPEWTSREMVSPLTPVIVNGVVFAVSSGEVRAGNTAAQRAQSSSRAILYALDGATGKELWNSGNTIATFVHSGGLSAGAGQMYLGSYDGTLYAFGFPIEH